MMRPKKTQKPTFASIFRSMREKRRPGSAMAPKPPHIVRSPTPIVGALRSQVARYHRPPPGIALRYQHSSTLQGAAAQIAKRVICPGERVGHCLGPDPGFRCQCQELLGIAPGQVGDRAKDPFFP